MYSSIYFLAVVGLCCCTWAFSSFCWGGYSLIAGHRLLIVVASLTVDTQALGTQASAVMARGL